MRAFIAVDFSLEIKEKIAKIIKYFKTQTPDNALKWVASQNLHMTIKFLGEVPEENIQKVKDIISTNLKGISAFEIAVEGMGMYPNTHQPRVIWLGIEGSEPLKHIHKTLDSALQTATISPDKRVLSPHLTIARIRRKTDKLTVGDIGKTLSQFEVGFLGKCTINEIVLYQSVLTAKGPIYTSLLSNPLDKV